jgi:hypothetical protein
LEALRGGLTNEGKEFSAIVREGEREKNMLDQQAWRVWRGTESDGRIITWIKEESPAEVEICHIDKVCTAVWLLIKRVLFME